MCYIQAISRDQSLLFPDVIDHCFIEHNPIRFIDPFNVTFLLLIDDGMQTGQRHEAQGAGETCCQCYFSLSPWPCTLSRMAQSMGVMT
jgi:hypothetical protein